VSSPTIIDPRGLLNYPNLSPQSLLMDLRLTKQSIRPCAFWITRYSPNHGLYYHHIPMKPRLITRPIPDPCPRSKVTALYFGEAQSNTPRSFPVFLTVFGFSSSVRSSQDSSSSATSTRQLLPPQSVTTVTSSATSIDRKSSAPPVSVTFTPSATIVKVVPSDGDDDLC